jgi:hypothetical protein
MSELETELALLREENARLKVERHRPADTGHVIERMRSIRPGAPVGAEEAATPSVAGSAQAMTECLVVREGLMDACQEVQQAMQVIRGRLEVLTDDLQARADDRVTLDQSPTSVVETVDVAPDATEESQSELAESVA